MATKTKVSRARVSHRTPSWGRPVRIGLIGLLGVAGWGCDEEPVESPPAREPAPAEPTAPAHGTQGAQGAQGAAPDPDEAAPEPSVAAGPRATDEGYVVELTSDGLETGQLGQMLLAVEGQGEWHLNQDFPFSVELRAPEAMTLSKTRFGKEDAASFADEAARVQIPVTPASAGDHRVEAEVRFAICNPQSCIPKTETVALMLHVQ